LPDSAFAYAPGDARRHDRPPLPSPPCAPPPMFGDSLELRVTLRDIKPPIWRTVVVPAHLPLNLVHDALQIAFGWLDCHLHDFTVGEVSFGMSDVSDEMLCVDERGAPLAAVATTGATFTYRYDFGDCWDHDVVVERVVEGRDFSIRCTGGERACPPEDCGGVPGYMNLLRVLATPNHEEHDSMRAWVGKKYDPEKFVIAAVNKKLATLAKKVARVHNK
jgi:hypothetical protein